jgi:hypothetical protein
MGLLQLFFTAHPTTALSSKGNMNIFKSRTCLRKRCIQLNRNAVFESLLSTGKNLRELRIYSRPQHSLPLSWPNFTLWTVGSAKNDFGVAERERTWRGNWECWEGQEQKGSSKDDSWRAKLSMPRMNWKDSPTNWKRSKANVIIFEDQLARNMTTSLAVVGQIN